MAPNKCGLRGLLAFPIHFYFIALALGVAAALQRVGSRMHGVRLEVGSWLNDNDTLLMAGLLVGLLASSTHLPQPCVLPSINKKASRGLLHCQRGERNPPSPLPPPPPPPPSPPARPCSPLPPPPLDPCAQGGTDRGA